MNNYLLRSYKANNKMNCAGLCPCLNPLWNCSLKCILLFFSFYLLHFSLMVKIETVKIRFRSYSFIRKFFARFVSSIIIWLSLLSFDT